MVKINEHNYAVILNSKHERLKTALEIAERLLSGYKAVLEYANSRGDKWEDYFPWDFNLLYDLIERITDRIFENYTLIGDWNWKVHGFNVINLPNQN